MIDREQIENWNNDNIRQLTDAIRNLKQQRRIDPQMIKDMEKEKKRLIEELAKQWD